MEVVMYMMDGCPFCEKAKCFLREKGIPFKEIATAPGSREWEEMQAKTGGTSPPQALIGGVPVGGYADLVNMEATGELYEKLGMVGRKPDSPLYDTIIIGAGPAGMSAAVYTMRKLMKTLIISKEVGGQVAWSSDVENYLGFSHIDAPELVARFDEHVTKFGVEKLIGLDVTSVELTGRIKRVMTEDGKTYLGKTLIIATGGRHRPLNIPGERELVGKGVSYCSTCDAPLYNDAEVAVIGGGNSALEAALDLINIAGKIHIISLHKITGDPIYQGKLQKSQKVEILTEYEPLRILGENGVHGIELQSLKTGEIKTLPVEGVFVEIGIMPNSSLFIDTLATNPKGEILIDAECRTGVAGVFACGDVTNVPYKQVVVAVGEGSKAALSAYSYLINQK